MNTISKIKIASRIGALALAAVAYVSLSSNQSGVEVDMDTKASVVLQDTVFRTADYPQGPNIPESMREGTRSQLQSTVCPPGATLCASAKTPSDPSAVILWQGNSSKF